MLVDENPTELIRRMDPISPSDGEKGDVETLSAILEGAAKHLESDAD